MKTELEGQELDAGVASALGMETSIRNDSGPVFKTYQTPEWLEVSALEDGRYGDNFQPSTAWQHGGPIIERERINIEWDWVMEKWLAGLDHAALPNGVQRSFASGPTPLVAAMRAFAASRAKS
jgi:hypothetical protein